LDAFLHAVEASAFAAYIRESVLLYPAANVLHVLAVLVFFAAVAVMDLRLLQVIRGMPAAAVIERMRPVAVGALVVTAATGALLFVPEAVKMAANPAFLLKLAAIGLALANVGVNDWALRRAGETARLARASAGLSLALWLCVAALGRAIAYV
jgi:hypothetical protein